MSAPSKPKRYYERAKVCKERAEKKTTAALRGNADAYPALFAYSEACMVYRWMLEDVRDAIELALHVDARTASPAYEILTDALVALGPKPDPKPEQETETDG